MLPLRSAVWLAAAVAGFLVAACSSDKIAGSAAPSAVIARVPSEGANIYATDPCLYDASIWCHGSPIIWEYTYWATSGYGDPQFDCPEGCSTWPLGVATKNMIKDIINNHIKSDAACSWIVPFLTASLNYGRIRHYGQNYFDLTGDSHWTGNNNSPYSSDIHIHNESFGSTRILGFTLIHEGAHIHFNSENEDYVEQWANLCYKP
jgi:hypothetical protein